MNFHLWVAEIIRVNIRVRLLIFLFCVNFSVTWEMKFEGFVGFYRFGWSKVWVHWCMQRFTYGLMLQFVQIWALTWLVLSSPWTLINKTNFEILKVNTTHAACFVDKLMPPMPLNSSSIMHSDGHSTWCLNCLSCLRCAKCFRASTSLEFWV